jgi:RNA polymerase sigma-70 factor (ECF subfamily)
MTSEESLTRARAGDRAAFDDLVKVHARELRAHCYRMLASTQDADDAVQEALLGAWNGIAQFEGRSSLRSWLYTIATNACLRLVAQRPRRLLSSDYAAPREPDADLGEPVAGPIWVEPCNDFGTNAEGADSRQAQRESLELAFVAALQYLPGTQRAALILCDVMDFSAAEAATALDTSVQAVNSALQRARVSLATRANATSQGSELLRLGDDGQRALVSAFSAAWQRSDVAGLVKLLTHDARLTMPPLPAWFDGRDSVARFFAVRIFATPWRLVPIRPNGQLGFACYQLDPASGIFRLGAVNALNLRSGEISAISGFLDPRVHAEFGLPETFSENLCRER